MLGMDVKLEGGQDTLLKLKSMLERKSMRHKLEAMRTVVGLLARGYDVSNCFPEVVKNVTTSNTELKKLVYLFLVHYSSTNHELALLAISSFHNDLRSPHERFRANALKAMCSMRVPAVFPLLLVALQHASKDSSAYVRKSVAHAVPKLFLADPSAKDQLLDLLRRLVADRSLIVFPSAVWALFAVFPEDGYLEFLHPHVRFFCKVIADLDAFSQSVVLETLLRYARKYFKDPSKCPEDSRDDDYIALVDSAALLLKSKSHSVVLEAAKILLYIGSIDLLIDRGAVDALMRSYSCCSRKGIAALLLSNILSIVYQSPKAFLKYVSHFFVKPSDPEIIWKTKMNILVVLSTSDTIDSPLFVRSILTELDDTLSAQDTKLATSAVTAIGRIGAKTNHLEYAERCIDILLPLLESHKSVVLAIREILGHHESVQERVLFELVRLLPRLDSSESGTKAAVIWMIGEYRECVLQYVPDILRQLCLTFTDEKLAVKHQVLTLAAKLMSDDSPTDIVQKMFFYVCELCRCDVDFDLRDKARMMSVLFKQLDGSSILKGLMTQSLRERKPVPIVDPLQGKFSPLVLGSLSHAVGQVVGPSYRKLPNFPIYPPPASIRDSKRGSISMHVADAMMSTTSSIFSASQTVAPFDDEKFYEETEMQNEAVGSDWGFDELLEHKSIEESDDWTDNDSEDDLLE